MANFNHFNQNKKKKPPLSVKTDNFIEALKSIGGGVTKGISKDLIGGTIKNTFDTLTKGPQASGDIEPGGSIEFDQLEKEQEAVLL